DVAAQIKEEFPNEKLVVFDKTIDELNKINNPNSKAAIMLIEVKKFKVFKTKKDKIVDELILDKVKKKDMVATQDKELKRRLKEKSIKVLTIRQKRYVKF
ncbi:hypothetical protein K8R33_02175, partial [archaeon]|nr:hypothetical protein [archaeon]